MAITERNRLLLAAAATGLAVWFIATGSFVIGVLFAVAALVVYPAGLRVWLYTGGFALVLFWAVGWFADFDWRFPVGFACGALVVLVHLSWR